MFFIAVFCSIWKINHIVFCSSSLPHVCCIVSIFPGSSSPTSASGCQGGSYYFPSFWRIVDSNHGFAGSSPLSPSASLWWVPWLAIEAAENTGAARIRPMWPASFLSTTVWELLMCASSASLSPSEDHWDVGVFEKEEGVESPPKN